MYFLDAVSLRSNKKEKVKPDEKKNGDVDPEQDQ